MKKMMKMSGVTFALWLAFASHLFAQQAGTSFVHISSTISQEAQAFLRLLPDPSLQPALPAADDIEAWIAAQQAREGFGLERQKPVAELLQPTVTEMEMGGVPVLDIKL